ncbi:MAG: hypothetical protein HOG52_09625, partial [Actinobacteria bacterium]|nr:hypothetical protein [Actinomycetota bacterium]
ADEPVVEPAPVEEAAADEPVVESAPVEEAAADEPVVEPDDATDGEVTT